MTDDPGRNASLLPQLWARRLLLGAVILALLYFAGTICDVAMPFFLAWIAAYLVSPAVDMLEKRLGWSRTRAVVLVMLAAALLLMTVVSITVPIVVSETLSLTDSFPRYRDRVLSEIDYWQNAGRIPPNIQQLAQRSLGQLQTAAPEIASWVGQRLFAWLGSLLGIFDFLLGLFLFLFVFFYFLRDYHVVSQRLVAAVPERHRAVLNDLLVEIDAGLRTVLRGQFLVALAMAGLYGVGLTLAGVPYALLIGLAAGFGNFLPYVGPLLGLIPALGFTALHATDGLQALAIQSSMIVLVFIVVQVLESYFLTPKFAGESAGLGPVAVLFSVSLCGTLLGVVGVIVALPLAAVARVLLIRGWRTYQKSEFYAGS